jgi:hypothetical protein
VRVGHAHPFTLLAAGSGKNGTKVPRRLPAQKRGYAPWFAAEAPIRRESIRLSEGVSSARVGVSRKSVGSSDYRRVTFSTRRREPRCIDQSGGVVGAFGAARVARKLLGGGSNAGWGGHQEVTQTK